jgi:hypothetical protein
MSAVAIVLVVLVAWAFILFKPSRRPDLMNSLAGCYRGDGQLAGVEMVISPEGMLNAQGQTLKVTIAQDKIGISFLPDRRITYDPAFPSKLVLDSSGPLLMRISADRRSVTIPGEAPDIVFQKVACSGTTQPAT